MKVIDNITELFGDDLKQSLDSGARLKIAASCFSIYSFEALKDELEKVDSKAVKYDVVKSYESLMRLVS